MRLESIAVHLCLLTQGDIDPQLRELKKRFPAVNVEISFSHGILSVLLHSSHAEQLNAFKEAFFTHFSSHIFSLHSEKIQQAIQEWFLTNHKFLAFAESCTGGAMASQIISLPGASEYFLGSLVTYSDAFKKEFLGVSQQTLKEQSAVSEACVKEMLAGLFRHPQVDFAIAVSGIAGPTGGTQAQPVGTIWAAICERAKDPDVGRFHISGSRTQVIELTSSRLLAYLWRKVVHNIPAFTD